MCSPRGPLVAVNQSLPTRSVVLRYQKVKAPCCTDPQPFQPIKYFPRSAAPEDANPEAFNNAGMINESSRSCSKEIPRRPRTTPSHSKRLPHQPLLRLAQRAWIPNTHTRDQIAPLLRILEQTHPQTRTIVSPRRGRGPRVREPDFLAVDGKERAFPAAEGFDEGDLEDAVQVVVVAGEG